MSRKPVQFETHPTSYAEALQQGRFRAWGEGVVDGDTYSLLIDLGFYQYAYERIRLSGVDTPEIYGVSHDSEEYERGQEAKRFVQQYVSEQPVLVQTLEQETFGRFVGHVWVLDGDGGWQALGSMLKGAGFAE